MKYVDQSFAVAVAVFSLGALTGGFLVLILSPMQGIIISLLQTRVITPVRTVSRFGSGALLLLVFLNNSIPPLLSFAYPFVIARLNWTPPLTKRRRCVLLTSFTVLSAFLIGFFGLGATLSMGWILGGQELLFNLLKGAWVHGPIELTAILLCASEPLRIAEQESPTDLKSSLLHDGKLLAICLFILMLSAGIEVFVGV